MREKKNDGLSLNKETDNVEQLRTGITFFLIGFKDYGKPVL